MKAKQAKRFVQNNATLSKLLEPYTLISDICIEFQGLAKPKIQFYLQSNRWVIFTSTGTRTMYGDLISCLNWYHKLRGAEIEILERQTSSSPTDTGCESIRGAEASSTTA